MQAFFLGHLYECNQLKSSLNVQFLLRIDSVYEYKDPGYFGSMVLTEISI